MSRMTEHKPTSPGRGSSWPHQARPIITELVLLHFATMLPSEDHQFHMHPYHQLDISFEGEVGYHFERAGEKVLHSNSCVMIPPLVHHRLHTRKPTTHLVLKCHVAPHFAEALGDEPIVVEPGPEIYDYLIQASRRYVEGHAFATGSLIAASTLVLLDMLDARPAGSPRSDELQQFRQLLLPVLYRVSEPPFSASVAEMAQACYMSTDHFSRQFQQLLFISPRQFLQETRFRIAARDLLSHPPMTMEAIAERAGYGSVTAFGRAFRQHFEMSPKAYRNNKLRINTEVEPVFRKQAENQTTPSS